MLAAKARFSKKITSFCADDNINFIVTTFLWEDQFSYIGEH